MTCPVCGGNTAVVDSRKKQNDEVYRRRKCHECNYRFSTLEIEVDIHKRVKIGQVDITANVFYDYNTRQFAIRDITEKGTKKHEN